MPQLVDLEGVEGNTLEAAGFTSRTAGMRLLRKGERAITAAGDDGAITVYKQDDGTYRCEFHRYLRTLNDSQFKYLGAVDSWLKEWMPKLYEFHS